MQLEVCPRPSPAFRCAYCHDQLGESRRCPRCATALHEDCWVLAGGCPSLGCPRAPRARAFARRGDPWQLLSWLAAFLGLWLGLAVVSPAAQEDLERGVTRSDGIGALFAVARLSTHPLGILGGVSVVVGSIVLFRRHGHSPRTRGALSAAIVAAVLFVAFAAMALLGGLARV